MEIRPDSEVFFIQDPEYVVDYLKFRGIEDDTYFSFIRDFRFGLLKRMRFAVNDKEFEISHILGRSNISGYDIVATNENLGFSDGEDVAIALLSGDDAICYNKGNENVCIVYSQQDGRDKIEIDKSLASFAKRFESKEEKK